MRSSYNRFFGIILVNNIGKGVNGESGGDILIDNSFEYLVSWDNSQVGFNINQDADGTVLKHATVGLNGHGVRFGSYGHIWSQFLGPSFCT